VLLGIRDWFNGLRGDVESLTSSVFSFRDTVAGVKVTPHNAMSLATYYACIRNISEDIGKIPTQVFKALPEGKGKERLFTNTVDMLFNVRANEEMTPITVKQTIMANCLGWGNGYAEIIRNGRGEVVELIPIYSPRVQIMRDHKNKLFYRVFSSFTFCGLNAVPQGEFQDLKPQDMFHIKGLGYDGVCGISVLQYASESIGGGIAAQDFGNSFYGNGAWPGLVVEHPATLGKEACANLRDSINDARQGANKAHKTMILEENAKIKAMTVNPKDAMVIDYHKFKKVEIATWFRMPPEKVQDLERSTFNNSEQQNINYVTDTLLPWVIKWEQEISFKLLSKPDNFAKFDINSLLRGDMKTRSEFYNKMFQVGAYSINKILDEENLNPIGPEGDAHYVPLNLGVAGDTDPDTDPAKFTKIDNNQREEPENEPKEPEEDEQAGFDPVITKAVTIVNNKERKASGRKKKLDSDEQCMYAYSMLSPIMETYQNTKGNKDSKRFDALMDGLSNYYAEDNREIDDNKLIEIFKHACK
jgi:HK97 family phage portal protein